MTLFNIKINSITKSLTPEIDGYFYVDDFCIIARSKYMKTAERQLQPYIHKIIHWANTNEFKISKNKTRCVHFCQLRKMDNDPLMKLEHTDISVVNEYKFLGIMFNWILSYIPHIKYLKTKTTGAQQLLQVVAHTKWGTDRQTLLKLYRALVRSQLDYSSFIYRSARKSNIKNLDPIHHEGLRLVLGAFKTSPVSLYTEAHEAPLWLGSKKLALQYCI